MIYGMAKTGNTKKALVATIQGEVHMVIVNQFIDIIVKSVSL